MINGIGNSSTLSQLFSRLDSKGQGYLEKSDFASAFSAIGESDASTIEDVFAALDTDSDGKVTESEFSSTVSQLQQELDSQFTQMRMQGMAGQGPQGMAGGMPPPPPNDSGFTQEELESQLEEIGDSDSDRASLISDIVSNFEAADTDGDGKVTFKEAMAYKDAQSGETDSTAQAQAAAAAMPPPPPPPSNDAGFTAEELTAQLNEIGESDSARASLISDIVSNFEAADTDGDGKVSFKEAMAYREEQSGSTDASASTTQQVASDESQVMQRILQLMQAYGGTAESTASSLLSTLA